MLKMRDASKMLPRDDPQYEVWVTSLTTVNERAHRFNSGPRSAREAADYLVQHFDDTGRTMLEMVNDYSSAVVCGKHLDRLVPLFLRWFQKWIVAAALPKSKRPSRKAQNEVRKRLLYRAEHWKAEAHARFPSLSEQPTRHLPPKDELAKSPARNGTASAEGAPPPTAPAAATARAFKKRGRPTRFTMEQLRTAYEMKQAGKRNNEVAKVLYSTKSPTPEQRRSVPTTLKHHFPSKK